MDYFDEADPLVEHLHAALLPEMEFVDTALDAAVECLRHLAGRALAASAFPVPGGVSITLIAEPARRIQPVDVKITLGMSVFDALSAVAVQTGLHLVYGAVGVLLCPPEVAQAAQHCLAQRPLPLGTQPVAIPIEREHRLRLLAFYPVLAVVNHPLSVAWVEAFLKSDLSARSAYEAANAIVGRHPGSPFGCLTQIPLYLPATPEGPTPSEGPSLNRL